MASHQYTDLQPAEYPRGRHSARILAPFLLLFLVIAVSLLTSLDASISLSAGSTIAVCITLLLALLVQQTLVNHQGVLQIDLSNPASVYGMFYFAYYGIPMMMLCAGLGPLMPSPEFISGLTLLGYLAFVLGTKLIGSRKVMARPHSEKNDSVSLSQWLGLMSVVFLSMAFVATAIVLSIRNGMFFLHNQASKVYLSDGARFFNVVSPVVESPLILLLGVAARVPNPTLKRYSILALWGYTGTMTLVWVSSSQFRPAFTGAILFLIALGISGTIRVKVLHLVAAGLLALACLGITRGVRELNYGFLGRSENQLSDSLKLAQQSVESSNPLTRAISPATARRAAGSIRLLSEIMDANSRGYDFVYGRMFVESVSRLVPRVVWPDKPPLEAFQSQMRRHFGLEITDDPASLLVYSYANGGTLGVFLGFFALGWFLKRIGFFLEKPSNIDGWIFCSFVWTAVLQFEQETLLLTLSTLRVAICFWVFYKLARISIDMVVSQIRPSRTLRFNRVSTG